MIFQLVYTSLATHDMPLGDRLDLVRRSARNNLKREVTGILLYRDRRFIQILEGKKNVVEALVAKLKLDKRHQDVRVLASTDSDHREFSRWNMKLFNPELCEAVSRTAVETWFERAQRGADVDCNDIELFLHHAAQLGAPRTHARP